MDPQSPSTPDAPDVEPSAASQVAPSGGSPAPQPVAQQPVAQPPVAQPPVAQQPVAQPPGAWASAPPAQPPGAWATAPPAEPAAQEPAPPRRSRGAVAAIWILGIALTLALAGGAWIAVQFLQAQERIADQNDQIEKQTDQIEEQQDQIEEQQELVDKKETFGAAMAGLLGTAAQFEGALTASIVPWDEFDALARDAWINRWDSAQMTAVIEQTHAAAADLEAVRVAAQAEAATNSTGTAYEATIDRLGGGFVRSSLDGEHCGIQNEGILGCVSSSDPYLVHFDATAHTQPYMTDELRTGIAYHEFAHVLQFTNPTATEAALPAFGGDWEFMADCFALTFFDGWKLDHRVWVSSYEYWDVNIGYGQECSPDQQQAVRDWYGQLGVTLRPVSS